ncbi:hypothetical protein SAMN05444414_103255 [Roseovarius marisflavi]|uniref:Uncharacterized protein n=1 Tax=Roseovarius marisflavi TaxID=1054996 RepID=A0A1M6X2A0_9RHOB|nr:hypothetical protein [Roseovarius marisflavi]SHL00152.1 hypothetical protein SAMN05444414_103255 [Roseovarius marisflavi]
MMNDLLLLAALVAVLLGLPMGYRKDYRHAAKLVGGAAACLAAAFVLAEVFPFLEVMLFMMIVAFASLGVLIGSVIGVSLGWLVKTVQERLRG